MRVALTPEQVAASPRLRQSVIVKKDSRYKWPRRYRAVECEAVGQAVLERMLRQALDAMLPEPLADVQLREEREGAKLRAALAKLARTKR
jgi:hypothetical protein